MTFPPEVWDGVLRRLQARVAPISFDLWLSKIDGIPAGEALELRCPNQFHCDRIREYFLSTIEDCLTEELGRRVPIRIEVSRPVAASDNPPACAKESAIATSSAAVAVMPLSAIEHSNDSDSAEPRTQEPTGHRAKNYKHPIHGSDTRQPSNETQPVDRVISAAMSGIRTSAAETRRSSSPGEPRCDSAPFAPPQAAGRTRPTSNSTSESRGLATRGKVPSPPKRISTLTAPREQFRQPVFPLTFDSFAVGSCNALAREAAFAIASQKHLSLNQLFLTSAPGLGKTHLARAVALETKRILGERARYTTAESFTNEFTHSLRGGQMSRFKRRYRGDCDFLIFEDIQFLEGKGATQLEFFHTVQHILDCGGRVLLTGDRFPQEYQDLDKRVRARISSGFVAELDTPDETVRANILRSKAAHGGVRLPDDCVELLVASVHGNVRELEGALIQLVTMASLLKRPIDLELTRQSVLGRAPRPKAPELRASPSEVIKVVASFFKTSPAALAAKSRRRDVLLPRQLAMYLCRRYTDASLAEIGKSLGRDHPSVANAIRKVERQVLENVRLRYRVESLIERLDELGYRPMNSLE